MFDMQKIGRKISLLRRENNMTQMELADKLGISYQAVSNWERGNNMPDISKLPELAALFNTSVSELLETESPLVTAAVNNRLEECVKENPVSADELSDVLPLLKPTQVDGIAKSVVNAENLRMFLPFLGEDTVEELAAEAFGKDSSIQMFLPFLCPDAVEEFASQTLGKGGNIQEFLPFLCPDAVEEFAAQALGKGGSIQMFLPFLCPDAVEEFAAQALGKGGNIQEFLPFLSKDALERFASQTLGRGGSIQMFLPFLSEKSILNFMRGVSPEDSRASS